MERQGEDSQVRVFVLGEAFSLAWRFLTHLDINVQNSLLGIPP
jgi:hypothetical protein